MQEACTHGHLLTVQKLLAQKGKHRVDVHAGNEIAFRLACENGHVAVVRELLALGGDRRVDVHADEEGAYQSACYMGHMDIVQLLLSLDGDRRIDMHARQQGGLGEACLAGNTDMIRALLAEYTRRGCEWDAPELRYVMFKCLQEARDTPLRQAVAALLVEQLPLPNAWEGLMVGMVSREEFTGELLEHETETAREIKPVAQQLLLHTLRAELSVRGAHLLPEGGRTPALDAVALWEVLPVRQCCPQHLGELLLEAWEEGGALVPDTFRRDVGWQGVGVPVVAAPGSDALRGREGALQRVARKGMVLHRAATRG